MFRSKLILGSLILLSLALSIFSVVSITPVYSKQILDVWTGATTVTFLAVGGTATKPAKMFAVIGGSNAVFITIRGSNDTVQDAMVSVVVDGTTRCISYSQNGVASDSCKVAVGAGSHRWYVTASKPGYTSGRTPTYSFTVYNV